VESGHPESLSGHQNCIIGAFGELLNGKFTVAVEDPVPVGAGEQWNAA
jgi:hypothetical protein